MGQGRQTSSVGTSENKKTAVIIGCGISGAVAADELRKAGYQVTILEKNNRVGGKLKSEKQLATNGIVPELGGVVLTSNYPVIDTIIKHKIPTDKVFRISRGVDSVVYQTNNPTYWDQIKFGFEFFYEYCKFAVSVWQNNNAMSQQQVPNNSYTQMFSNFADQYGLSAINNFMKLWIPGMGYGPNENNYTFRILNYMGYATLPTLALGSYFNHHLVNVRPGFQSVVEKMVADMDVRLGVHIQSIIRKPDGTATVNFKAKNGSNPAESLEADLLVLTMSPECWPGLNMPLTETEKQCAADVRFIPYATAICDIKEFPKEHVFVPEALEKSGLGHIGFITTKDSRDNPADGRRCTVFVNLDAETKNYSLEPGSPGETELRADLAKLGYNDVSIKATKIWKNYNATLPPDTGMALEKQQGQNGTLYVGSYSPKSFETVAGAESYTRAIVQHFCNTEPSMLQRVATHLRRTFQFFYSLPAQYNEMEPMATPSNNGNSI